MAKTRKNNRQLKSMEEFKCKGIALKLVFTTLIVILVSLVFFSRGNTSQEVAKAETACIDFVNQIDTNKQKDTKNTSIPEASDIVETESQVETEESTKADEPTETEESVETSESIEAIQDIESADYVENTDSASETTSSEEQVYEDFVMSLLEDQVYEDFIIPIADSEIVLLTTVVLHEVGPSQPYYPYAEIDYLQQCATRVVVNQVIEGRWGNCVYDILFYPGHFPGIETWSKKAPDATEEEIEICVQNIIKVLHGEDSISTGVTIEMSFVGYTLEESIEIIESQVKAPVVPYFWTYTADKRLLIFAELNKSAKPE